MQKGQVVRNATTSALQVIVSSCVLFVLYRYLLGSIGVAGVGVWSLILAAASLTRLSDAGLSGSVVKFVAQYSARGDMTKAGQVVETAVLSIAVSVGVILVAVSPGLQWLLGRVVPPSFLVDAKSLLPYALASFWLTNISMVFQGSLDGMQRADMRNVLLISSSVLQLLLALALVPRYGLIGLGFAQIIQSVVLLIASWAFARSVISALPLLPFRWNGEVFREMIRYAVSFQIIGLITIFFDPITKGLLSVFGGLTAVAYFEMASKLVLQLRQLLMAVNLVLAPVFADLYERAPGRVADVYRESYGLLLFLAVPFYAIVIAGAPVISRLWIGKADATFTIFTVMLVAGWGANTLAGPAWVANLGSGRLAANIGGTVVTGLVNGLLGSLLGTYFGALGVVSAWGFGLALGAGVIVGIYHVQNGIPLQELIPSGSRALLFSVLLAVLSTGLAVWNTGVAHQLLLASVGFGLTMALGLVVVWKHPMRERVLRLIGVGLSGLHRRQVE